VTVRHVPRRAIVYGTVQRHERYWLIRKYTKGIGLQERVLRKVLASRTGLFPHSLYMKATHQDDARSAVCARRV